ncbi:hypothetical protein DV515_00013251, partial [Chloebia gouldiae]
MVFPFFSRTYSRSPCCFEKPNDHLTAVFGGEGIEGLLPLYSPEVCGKNGAEIPVPSSSLQIPFRARH